MTETPIRIEQPIARQRSLKAPISCVGTGLHSGLRVSMRLLPAPADHGIVFRRTDIQADIHAQAERVVDTRLCTVLAHAQNPAWRVGTVEHLLAAMAGLGVDNALVEVDGPELPILDGSAQHLVFLIDCAGIAELAAPRRAIEILRPVRVGDDAGFAELRPAPRGFAISVAIDFPNTAIGRQAVALDLDPARFRAEIAPARTFALLKDVEAMRGAGLALGGSLENAIVVDGPRILNPGGLRLTDEFARHKLLDVIGDLALAGAPIRGRYVGHRPGHALNNRLLRAVLADPSAWRHVPADLPADGMVEAVPLEPARPAAAA